MNFPLKVDSTGSGCVIQPLASGRLATAKRGFTTRRVTWPEAPMLVSGEVAPRPGDLVLARVNALGHHTKLEAPLGRRVGLHEGDDIAVVYGARYAPDQFLAEVPQTLGSCDLVAGGGVAGAVKTRSDRARRPTRLTPYGLIADERGQILNLRDFALPPVPLDDRPRVVAVVGSSMNAGKTSTVAALTLALKRAGRDVGVLKATGTGSGGDLWSALDAGARTALDFTDAGHASTHGLAAAEIEGLTQTLCAHLVRDGHDAILIEVADGLLLGETADLIKAPAFQRLVDDVVFAASDAMSALAGETWLTAAGVAPRFLTGQFTRAPLAQMEVENNTATPVLGLGEVSAGAWLPGDLSPHGQDPTPYQAVAK